MKVVAYNASPRKKGNTAVLLQKALDGAASKGAQTELIHLYDLKYHGCTSCFSCKLKDGPSYGKCAMKDGLTPVLEKFADADAVLFGSPIYFNNVTGELRSFLERLWFQYLIYTKQPDRSLFQKSMRSYFIYTMNVTEEGARDSKLDELLKANERTSQMIFHAPAQSYFSYETKQFDDYSKYVADMFDAAARAKRHEEVFPADCENCFDIGIKLVESFKIGL